MKKTNIWMLMAPLVVGIGMNLTSCKEEELTEEEMQQQVEQTMEWWDVVSQLTDVQDYPEKGKKATFEPAIGTASESDPYTRVIPTNDLATAAQRFAYLTGAPVDETTADYTWSHKDAGSLTYHAGSTSGTYLAQVDVNLKQIPKLKKILYQTPEQMGENASGSFSGTAYYRFGDVVKKLNSSGNYDYWVCVRPAFSLERKGDSHWITLCPLPAANIYTYSYKDEEWALPTKLGDSKEHMQNFAEMLYAILAPQQYYSNLGSDLNLEVFHDFSRDIYGQYHSQYFWERVSQAWDAEDIYSKLFNGASKMFVGATVTSEEQGLTLLYKGYSWLKSMSWNCSLWQAHYKNDDNNMHTATYTTPSKNMEGVDFDVSFFYENRAEYTASFFGDDKIRYIVRYATGEKLCKNSMGKGSYSVKNFLSNCEDVYVYNKYFFQNEPNGMYDLNSAPEILTEDDVRPKSKPISEVEKDDRGKVIGQDGMIYASKKDAERAGTKAVAMVVDTYNTDYTSVGANTAYSNDYMEKTWYGFIKKGIAIALEDGNFNGDTGTDDRVTVRNYDKAWDTDHKVTGATWYVPNIYHWQRLLLPYGLRKIMVQPYIHDNLEDKFENNDFDIEEARGFIQQLNEIGAPFENKVDYLVAGGQAIYKRYSHNYSLLTTEILSFSQNTNPEVCRYVLVW